jgi:hypothetical protein
VTNKGFAGAVDSLDESTLSEDSLEPNTPIIANEETNDSDSHSSAKRYDNDEHLTPAFLTPSILLFRSIDSEEHPETGEPELKKAKNSE